MLEWLKTKLYLDSKSISSKTRQVKRGQVYWCEFGVGIGSEMQKKRPCVIIQNDIANLKSPNTLVVSVTHDSSTLPCTVQITPVLDQDGNIILDGQANASTITCVSKARLGDYICDISKLEMKQIDEAIAKSTGIMVYYSQKCRSLEDKLNYIEKIKKDRNDSQDKLKFIREIFNISEDQDILKEIEKIQKMIDKS